MQQYRSKLQDGGRVVIPAKLRKELGIKEGEYVVFRQNKKGDIAIMSYRDVIRKVQQTMAKYIKPGQSLVDSLLNDRREEARRESDQ